MQRRLAVLWIAGGWSKLDLPSAAAVTDGEFWARVDPSSCIRDLRAQQPGAAAQASLRSEDSDFKPQFVCVLWPKSMEKMLIPAMFVQNNIAKGDLNNRMAVVFGPLGKVNNIKIEMVQSDMFFAGGWPQFLAFHDITESNALLLRYEGNMVFTVKVFEPDGCQRIPKHKDNIMQQKNQKQTTESLKTDSRESCVESLPSMLHRNYSLMRELDKSLQGVQLENEQRCQQEIEDVKHGLESRSITYDPTKLKFSEEAIEEQKHCVRIADEKVALATQTYDLVDAHIQQLDQFLRKLEEIRQEKEAAAAVAAGTVAAAAATPAASAGVSTADATPKTGRSGERGRGGRKKAKVPTEPQAPPIDLELPVDPNEPTYCICNQVSYGEMVACDNPNCKIEWYHIGCVGVKELPKGKWFCPSCVGFQKKRKGK